MSNVNDDRFKATAFFLENVLRLFTEYVHLKLLLPKYHSHMKPRPSNTILPPVPQTLYKFLGF